MINKEEKIIMSIYTGILMCDFSDVHERIEQLCGRPVFTHELASKELTLKLKELVKDDFIKIINQPTTLDSDVEEALINFGDSDFDTLKEDNPSALLIHETKEYKILENTIKEALTDKDKIIEIISKQDSFKSELYKAESIRLQSKIDKISEVVKESELSSYEPSQLSDKDKYEVYLSIIDDVKKILKGDK